MIYIKNKSTDPYFNLALEEYLLTKKDQELFMLWQNHNTIVVGKNQNTASEINADFVSANNIAVVRRLTGGGAVYHDTGNINFTFIVENNEEWFSKFSRFTNPIIEVLGTLGVHAVNSGRNDILVDGCKISGNSQTVYKNRLMHHGTLLFNADISRLAGALNVNQAKIISKGISSVKSRVTNIADHMQQKMSVHEFIDLLANSFQYQEYKLTEEDILNTQKLVDEKYGTWEWNYGYSPLYTFKNNIQFDGGFLEVTAEIRDGIIKSIRFHGDFFGISDVSEIETALVGIRHQDEELKKATAQFDLNRYFLNLKQADFIRLLKT